MSRLWKQTLRLRWPENRKFQEFCIVCFGFLRMFTELFQPGDFKISARKTPYRNLAYLDNKRKEYAGYEF